MNQANEKWQATLKSYDETIEEVVRSEIIHPFPDVKPSRYNSYRSRSKKNLSSASCSAISTTATYSDLTSPGSSSISKSSSFQQITNTVSCSHEDSACACVSTVRENKNLTGKYARDYREQMLKKAKYSFVEFYGLFRFIDYKTADEKREYTSLKQERFDFFGLDPNDSSDVGLYHHLIKDIMKEMNKKCGVCLDSRFVKASNCETVNFVTTDCTHVFCATCFKDKRIVCIIFFAFVNFLLLIVNFIIIVCMSRLS
jgi:hypothetical protein